MSIPHVSLNVVNNAVYVPLVNNLYSTVNIFNGTHEDAKGIVEPAGSSPFQALRVVNARNLLFLCSLAITSDDVNVQDFQFALCINGTPHPDFIRPMVTASVLGITAVINGNYNANIGDIITLQAQCLTSALIGLLIPQGNLTVLCLD